MPLHPKQVVMLLFAIASCLAGAAAADPSLHVLAAAVSAAYAVVMLARETGQLQQAGANHSAVAAATARSLAWVWLWGGLAILITYTVIIDRRWPEWWQFAGGFTLAGIVSLGFAAALQKDAAAGKSDEAMLKAGRWLAIAQIVGVVAALATMFIEGKFPRDISFADWAGVNIFMFGGLAILVISLYALRQPLPSKA